MPIVGGINTSGVPDGLPCRFAGNLSKDTSALTATDIHSLLIAWDYRVPDPSAVWELLEQNKAALADIGAYHVLVYTSTHDYGRLLVMIGVHIREPIVELLRSRFFFDWFDAFGADDIPAVFAGELFERFAATPSPVSGPPGVVMAAFASVDDVSALTAEIRMALDRFTTAGIRKMWIYHAFDNADEVLVLQEFPDEHSARQWIDHPDAAAQWMSRVGVGGYPPLFVGRFFDSMQIEAPR